MKRLVLLALAIFVVFVPIARWATPVFAPVFRGLGQVTFSLLFGFEYEVDFRPNLDPSSRSQLDTTVVLTRDGSREIFGFFCDSGGLGFRPLALFLALWIATPLKQGKRTALKRGLALLYLFFVARIGLMVLGVLATHECGMADSHFGLLRQEWFGSMITFVNRELAMDLVVAYFGPFVIWAIVCGYRFALAWLATRGPKGLLPSATHTT